MNEFQATKDHAHHVSSEAMSLALDSLLDAAELQAFHSHLAHCQSCRQRWQSWQSFSDVLQVEPLVGPRPGFVLRVNDQLRRRQQRRERWAGGLVLVGGTVSIWALLMAGLVLTVLTWSALNPAVRVAALQYVGFVGQFIALIVNYLGSLSRGAVAGMPVQALLLVFSCVLLLGFIVWVKLIPASQSAERTFVRDSALARKAEHSAANGRQAAQR